MAITCALSPKQIEALYIKSVRELKKAKEQNVPFDHNAYMQDLFNKIAEKKDIDTAAKFIQQVPLLLLTAAVKPAFRGLSTDLNAIKALDTQFTNPETGVDTIINTFSTSLKELKQLTKDAEENLNAITLIETTDIIVENQYLPTIATSTSYYQLAPFSLKKQEDPLARRLEDENRVVSYKVLDKLKEAKQKEDGTIIYDGVEMLLKGTTLSKIPFEYWDETTQDVIRRNEVIGSKGKAKRASVNNTTVVVLTDTSGNPIVFDENAEISKTGEGIVLFQFLRNIQEVNGELVALDPFGEKESLASSEEIAFFTKGDVEAIKEQRKIELKKVKALNDSIIKGEEPFLSLLGISRGVPSYLIGNAIPLNSIVKAYPEEIDNIFGSIESAENGGSEVVIFGNKFKMDRPFLTSNLIEEIASALVSTKLSDTAKLKYYAQFYGENLRISDKVINHALNKDLTFYYSDQTFAETNTRFTVRARSINNITGNLKQEYLKTLSPDQIQAIKAQIVKSLTFASGKTGEYKTARFPIMQNVIMGGFFKFNTDTQTLENSSYKDVILDSNPLIATAYLNNDRTYNSYMVFDTSIENFKELKEAVNEALKSNIRKAKDDLFEYLDTKSLTVDVSVRFADGTASNQNERLLVENPITGEDLFTVVKVQSDNFLNVEENDFVTLKIVKPGMEGYNPEYPTAIGIYDNQRLLGFVAETDFKAKEESRKPVSQQQTTEIKKAETHATTLDIIEDSPQETKPEDAGEDPDTSINIFDRSVLLEAGVTNDEIKAAEKWWKNSPLAKFIKLDPAFKIVNSNAYARFVMAGAKLMSDGKFGEIQIHPSGSFVDVYHEAWHAFSQLFLTKDQKKELYDEVRNSSPKYKDYTYLQIEELLAEDFRSYAKSPKAKADSPKRNTIFRKIFNFLRSLFGLTKTGKGITQETYSSDLLEMPMVKELFETLYFADKNPNMLLRNYTPMMENAMFNMLDRGVEKIGKSKEDALSKSDSDLISKSIDGIISEFLDEQSSKFGSKSTSLAYFSEEIGKESGLAPKDVLYNVVRKRLEKRLSELKEIYGKDLVSPFESIKTLKDVEKASIGVIKSSKGDDKYIFLSSQVPNFNNLELAIKKGNKAKGRSYFGIDIVADFYRLKTVKNKNKKPVDIIIVTDRDNAVAQYENYIRGKAQEFTSIEFKEDVVNQTPTLSPKQERELHNIKVIEKALENWGDRRSGTIKYHIENSTFDVARQVYTEVVKFDENGNEIDESENLENVPGDTYADTVGTKSLLELADKETIYAIKSLFKLEKGKKVLNELGFPELVDFRNIWNIIARELANTVDRQVMYEKLVTLSESYPEIKQLIKYKLPAPNEIGAKSGLNPRLVNYEFNISNSFWQTFSKARIPILNNILFVKKDSKGKVEGFESQLLKSVKENPIILSSFRTKFKTNTESKYSTVLTDGTIMLNVNAVVDAFQNIDKASGSKKLEFVTALGFYIDDLAVIKKELDINSNYYGLKYIYQIVEGIQKIDKDPNATKEQKQLLTNFKLDPISVLQSKISKGLLPNFKIEVNQSTQVNRLAQLQASMGIESADFGANNAAGNKMYELMEQFTISKIVQDLNDIKRLNDAWDNTGTNIPKFTNYLDPKINSFTLRSQTLNSVFDLNSPLQEFTRRSPDAKIALEYLGGTAVEGIQDAFGSETTNLDPASYVLQQMHTMLKGGIVEFIRHASKSASFGMRVEGAPIVRHSIEKEANHLYVDISMFKDKSALNYAVENILIPYIAVEFDRINKFNSDPFFKNIAGYNKKFYYKGKEQLNGQSFLAFDDVLGEDVLDWLYSKATGKDLTIDIIAEINNPANSLIKDKIFSSIRTYFNNKTLENLDIVNQIGSVDSNLLAKGENLTNLTAAFTVNSWIHNFETIHLFYGDMAQYDHLKDDLFKRNTGATSNGPGFLNDTAAHNFINNVFNHKNTYAYKLAQEALNNGDTETANAYLNNMFTYNGILRTAVVEETVRPKSAVFDEIKDGLIEDYTEQFSRLNLSKAEIKKLVDERVAEDMKAYTNMEEGDGAGYITIDMYRTLKKLENDWSDPQDNLYQKIINNLEVSKDEVKLAFPAYKIQNYGPLAGVQLPAFAMHKFALFPIIPSVYKNSELEKLHKQMLKKNIQYVTFASGSKVASISKDGSPDKIYADESKTQVLDDIDFTPNLVHIESLKKATAVGAKLKGKIKEPTQKKGILIDNLFDNGIIRKESLKKPYEDFKTAVDEHSAILKVDFLNEIGFKYDSASGQYTGDLLKLLTVFQQELERRDVPEHLIEFLGVDLSGNLINDLSLHLEADTIEKIILAVIQKRLIDQVTNGEALVQMPNSMMNGIWDKKLKLETDPEKIKSLMGSNTLGFYERSYEIINGKKVYGLTNPMKIAIALQGDFYNLLELDYKGEKIATIDRLNEAIKDEEWLKENKEQVTISGARIPIQKHNSLEFAQVWHFLDPAAANTVIVPTELVAKAGSDFDVDKIFWNFPNLTKEGKLVTEETSIEEIERRLNSKEASDKKDLKNIIERKKKAAQNNLIKSMIGILERPEMYASLVKPNGTYIMKNLADELEEIATDYNRFEVVHGNQRTYTDKQGKVKKFASPTRALEVGMGAYKFQVNLEGKGSLGIVANQNKQSPIMKSIGAKLPKTFSTGYWDKQSQSVKETNMVFLPFTVRFKTNMLGDNISLSGNYSQDGERIADIYDHMMNGLLDIEKDAWVFFLQTNSEMVNTLNTLIEMGISKRDNIWFISQPISREYVKLQKRLKSTFRAAVTGEVVTDSQAKRQAAETLIAGRLPEAIVNDVNQVKIKHIINSISNNEKVQIKYYSDGETITSKVNGAGLKDILKSKPANDIVYIYSESGVPVYSPASLDTLLSSSNIYYLDEVLNEGVTFNYDELQKTINNSNADNQLNVLVHLLSLENQLKAWQEYKRVNTPDTKRVKTTYQMNKKEDSYSQNLESSKLDTETIEKLRNESVLSSFNISDFALDVVAPLFNLRMNPLITKYIGERLKNDRLLITQNGFPKGLEGEEMFTGAFNNAVINFIFQNSVSNFTNSDGSITSLPDVYRGKEVIIKANIPNHVEITEDKILIDYEAIKKDYREKVFEKENDAPNNYKTRGLKTFISKTDTFPTETSFVKFVVEREYLRSTTTLEQAKSNPLYKRIKQVIGERNVSENTLFEAYLAQKALLNSYNRVALMKTRNLSYSDLLMNIIETNKDALSVYPVIEQLLVIENPSLIRRGLRVIGLKNKSEATGELAETYENNLRQLADPSIKKVADKELNDYISQMFKMFPLVATYQHGVGYSMAGFPKILPVGGYLNIMKRAEDMFLTQYLNSYSLSAVARGLLKKENERFTKGYKNYVVEPAQYMGNTILELPTYTDPTDESEGPVSPEPSTQPSTSVTGININTKSSDKLGRELTNPNWGAKNIMDIEAEYKANASKIKAPKLSMDEALKYDMNLMYKLQMKKFKAHPELVQEITNRGGVKFLEASEHIVGVKGSRWEGKGTNSNFIKVLIKSYQDSLGTTQPSTQPTGVKEGVEELFESNPELANQVYETLGFNKLITPNDKIVFGHPTIGKSYLKKQGEDKFISLDDDYAGEINIRVNQIADKYDVTSYQVKDGGTQKWNNEYNQMMQEMFNVAKQKAISENKTLFTSNTNLLRTNAASFDKIINLSTAEFEKRIQERGAKYDVKEWKSQINEVISKLPTNKVINTDKYLSDLFITPQQKQQALQLYSQYLDTIFPDSQVKDIVYHGSKKNLTLESFDKSQIGTSTDLGWYGKGFYFFFDPQSAKYYGKLNTAILNIKNPYLFNSVKSWTDLSKTGVNIDNLQKISDGVLVTTNLDEYLDNADLEKLSKKVEIIGYSYQDSEGGMPVIKLTKDKEELVVFESEQIHILGSQKDIKGFKNFVQGTSTQPLVSNNPAEFINYHGGAKKYDTYWEEDGKAFGVTQHKVYTVKSYDELDQATKDKLESRYDAARTWLGRNNVAKDSYAGKLVRRDMMQAAKADAIFAISEIVAPGIKGRKGYQNKTNHPIVEGGTGYAVASGILLNKPVYVFNQDSNYGYDTGWYKWDSTANNFVKTDIPVLTKNYAGIGSSTNETELGKQAIRDVYAKTFKAPTTQPTDKLGLGGYKRGGKIISDGDITRFNTYLGKSNGVKPKEFFTPETKFAVFYNENTGKREGVPQTSKWMLKDNGYYDLIDQVSGEIYIDNVDLQTGYKFEEPLEGGFGTSKVC